VISFADISERFAAVLAALDLQLGEFPASVGACAVRTTGHNNTSIVLVQMRIDMFSREGQALDGSPPADDTELRTALTSFLTLYARDAVVRVTRDDTRICQQPRGWRTPLPLRQHRSPPWRKQVGRGVRRGSSCGSTTPPPHVEIN
jgi:hypothetical protein